MLKKTLLALALGTSLASSVLAQQVEQTIEIEHESGKDVKVVVNHDGNLKQFSIPSTSFDDEAGLRQILADVPQELQDKVIDAVSNIGEHRVMFTDGSDGEHRVEIIKKIVTDGDPEAKVIVVDIDDDTKLNWHSQDGDKKRVHKIVQAIDGKGDGEQAFHFTFLGDAKVEQLAELIKNTKLSQEELDKLQAILDSKR